MSGNQRIKEISARIDQVRDFVQSEEVKKALSIDSSAEERVKNVLSVCEKIKDSVRQKPLVDVALVGASRAGKSTLINSLAGEEILETSAVRPCSAAIVRLLYAEKWSVEISFVKKDDLLNDWRSAVRDAASCLDGKDDLSAEEAKYFKDTLERFIELFGVDKDSSSREKLDQIRDAKLPSDLAGLLGKTPPVEGAPVEKLKKLVSNYLSTEKNYWTIVDRCVIRGPFKNWHPNLCVVDLPGTNDTNAHRSLITERVRSETSAVGLVTQQGNLGEDIESWLRNSRVMANFIESIDDGRHHLFVIRTQLDNFVPQIDEDDEELEDELYHKAIEEYKREQVGTYREMFKDMILPVIDAGLGSSGESEDAIRHQRDVLLARVNDLRVFFVSSLAHEVFEGRAKVGKRRKEILRSNFNEEIARTGVPELKTFLNQIAAEYLEKNYYVDLERQIESEFEQLVNFFRSKNKSLEAAENGAGESVLALTNQVQNEIVPWVSDEVALTVQNFDKTCKTAEREIRKKLRQSWQLADSRFQDKVDKWNMVAWVSLKAMARKNGKHTTNRGQYLDVASDICGVLVDDVLLAWKSFRDDIIQKQVSRATQELSAELVQKLSLAKIQVSSPDAEDAIDVIVAEITSMADLQRDNLLRSVNLQIKKLESISRPAYEFIQNAFSDVFVRILAESGSGCQQRMRDHLIDGFNDKLPSIRDYINELIDQAVGGLLSHSSSALQQFGDVTTVKISDSVSDIEDLQKERDLQEIKNKRNIIEGVFRALPAPQKAI